MSTVETVSLREELGADPDPDFELKLLPGWTRWTPDGDHLVAMGQQARDRLAAAGRGDLGKEVHGMLHRMFSDMRRHRVVAAFTATEDRADTVWLPGSVLATIRHPGADHSLDDVVVHLIQQYGATPLLGDKRFVRTRHESLKDLPDGQARLVTIEYLTPVPTSSRRRALCLTASYGAPTSIPADDDRMRAIEAAFDAMVSTLRWAPPPT